MGSRPSKPIFNGVVDLGLRDVGVENDRRAQGRMVGRTLLQGTALIVLSLMVICTILGVTGAGWLVLPLVVGWSFAFLAFAMRSADRGPVMVIRVTAEGTNQVAWLIIGQTVPLAFAAVLAVGAWAIPVIVYAAVVGVFAWRWRGRVPGVLARVRPLLAEDEVVLGDAAGKGEGSRRWPDAFRLVVATDRRLLVVGAGEQTLLVDVPYERVTRFGVEWKLLGRVGALSVTVDGVDHEITYIGPANLVSVATALRTHGVQADDPEAVFDAESAWEEAKERGKRAKGEGGSPGGGNVPRMRLRDLPDLLDRAAMNTPQFDHALWLLLGGAAIAFYVNPFGIGIGNSRSADLALILIVPVVCGICAYISRTQSSVTYLIPLNLLAAAPAFFFWPAIYVVGVLVTLNVFAIVGLLVGLKLSERHTGPASAIDQAAGRPVPGSLRHALSGVRLIRITGGMLAVLLTMVVTASAAGLELTSVRLAVDELTLRQLPVDGRSDLTGDAASIRYTPGPGLHEFITDQPMDPESDAGARWELRSSWTKGFNTMTLAVYAPEDAASLEDFLARKDREHDGLAGHTVVRAELTVDGRKGYYWTHGSPYGYWHYAAWFPGPVQSVRVECIAKNEAKRFKGLCREAVKSLKFQ